MPSITPKTADRIAETPTSAIVGPAASLDLVPDGLVRLVRAPEVELGGLLEVVDELPAGRLVEAELARQLGPLRVGQVAPAEQVRHRIRLDDPEQEEVEADDEEQGRERPEDLAS